MPAKMKRRPWGVEPKSMTMTTTTTKKGWPEGKPHFFFLLLLLLPPLSLPSWNREAWTGVFPCVVSLVEEQHGRVGHRSTAGRTTVGRVAHTHVQCRLLLLRCPFHRMPAPLLLLLLCGGCIGDPLQGRFRVVRWRRDLFSFPPPPRHDRSASLACGGRAFVGTAVGETVACSTAARPHEGGSPPPPPSSPTGLGRRRRRSPSLLHHFHPPIPHGKDFPNCARWPRHFGLFPPRPPPLRRLRGRFSSAFAIVSCEPRHRWNGFGMPLAAMRRCGTRPSEDAGPDHLRFPHPTRRRRRRREKERGGSGRSARHHHEEKGRPRHKTPVKAM